MVEPEIIAFLSPIISALIIWYIQHRHMEHDKKRDELLLAEKRRGEEREKARKQENLLTMRMIEAIGKLSYANSVAIKEGKVNGVIEEALAYYRKVNDEMTKFLQEQAVEHYIK